MSSSSTRTQTRPRNNNNNNNNPPPVQNNAQLQKIQQPQWAVLVRSMLTWKHVTEVTVQPQLKQQKEQAPTNKKKKKKKKPHEGPLKKSKKTKCTGSLCSNTKIEKRTSEVPPTPETHKRRIKPSFSSSSTATSSTAYSVRHQLKGDGAPAPAAAAKPSIRRFSGCYECRMVVDPIFVGFAKDPTLRSNIFSCPDCGKVFMSPKNLDHHQAVKHAVSELSPDGTSKNIVKIIFQSSWFLVQKPLCRIDRILKIHNNQRTISRFENYRESIKEKATHSSRKHSRCVADGNELLRFRCTTLACYLGLDGSSNLCSSSIPRCNVCCIIRNGFGSPNEGTLTTATSSRAHEKAEGSSGDGGDRRAMLVCRVIAGRVRRKNSTAEEGKVNTEEGYDSVSGVIDATPYWAEYRWISIGPIEQP